VADDELSFDEFQRIYGPYEALTPAAAAELFRGAEFAWWVAGGWSAELTDVKRRFHEDIEIGVPRSDLPAVRQWLADYHLWDVHSGALRLLRPDDDLPDDHEQIWVRRDAYSPWLMDVMPTPVNGDTWYYKRDRRLTRPMRDVVVMRAGIPHQRPEVTLLYKAKHRRTKDEADFAAVVPMLTVEDRIWLRDAVALTEPADHPWLSRLEEF